MNDPAAHYSALLYELLPAVYRARDKDGELERFLRVFGEQFGWLRANLDRLQRDFYIESCDPRCIPYLADLVAARLVSSDPERQRAEVRHTVGWRRGKGTIRVLEHVAAMTAASGARGVDMLEHVAWTQQLNHLRSQMLGSVRLSDAGRMAALGTPFDRETRTVDLRSSAGGVARAALRAVACFVAWLRSERREGEFPSTADPLRYHFHPLGFDVPLAARGRPWPARGSAVPDNGFAHVDHVSIRGADFAEHPGAYLGVPEGFTVYEDGIPLAIAGTVESSAERDSARDFDRLHPRTGLKLADTSLVAGSPAGFTLGAVRVRRLVPSQYSPLVAFATQLAVAPEPAGSLDTATGIYSHGSAPEAGDEPVLLLRISRNGADSTFPECELVVTNDRGRALLVFLPELTGLHPTTPLYLYVAGDGATYFARADQGPGEPDRNPDAALFGAYSSFLLARRAQGQVRPRPGIRPFTPRRAVYRDLRCWESELAVPLEPGEVAFDPEQGRFRIAVGEAPTGLLTADCHRLVAGFEPARRPPPEIAGASVISVAKTLASDHEHIQDAIDHAPRGSELPVVIEIRDSATYRESLLVDSASFPGGLELRAAAVKSPSIIAPAGPALRVTASSGAAELRLCGLSVAGGDVEIAGAVPRLWVEHCTLIPETVSLAFHPSQPAALTVERSALGRLTTGPHVESVQVRDATLQHPGGLPEQCAGHQVLEVSGDLELVRSTVVGEVEAVAGLISESILCGALSLAEPERSCLRHSRLQTAPAGARRFRLTSAFPLFVSTRFGDPGYLVLHPNTADSLLRCSEDDGEIGAFTSGDATLRFAQIQQKLDEYAPAGIRTTPVRVIGTTPVFRE